MKKLTLTLTALAAVALATPALAVPVNSNSEDLVLGFRVSDATGTGASSDLETDLGQSSNFTTTSFIDFSDMGGTSMYLDSADLAGVFGSNYSSRGDVIFGVGGATPGGFVSTQFGTPAKEDNTVNQGSLNIQNVEQFLGGVPANAAGGSTEASVIGTSSAPASSLPLSYTSEILNPNGGAYGYGPFTITSGVAKTETVYNGATTLALYNYVPVQGRAGGTPTELGVFSLSATGNLTYTGVAYSAPVPEPSTWAMLFAGAGLLAFLVRRQRNGMVL